MTRDELTSLAQECGLNINANDTFSTSRESQYWVEAGYFDIERFAALVASAEREACAKACDAVTDGMAKDLIAFDVGLLCSHVIRARSNK